MFAADSSHPCTPSNHCPSRLLIGFPTPNTVLYTSKYCPDFPISVFHSFIITDPHTDPTLNPRLGSPRLTNPEAQTLARRLSVTPRTPPDPGSKCWWGRCAWASLLEEAISWGRECGGGHSSGMTGNDHMTLDQSLSSLSVRFPLCTVGILTSQRCRGVREWWRELGGRKAVRPPQALTWLFSRSPVRTDFRGKGIHLLTVSPAPSVLTPERMMTTTTRVLHPTGDTGS